MLRGYRAGVEPSTTRTRSAPAGPRDQPTERRAAAWRKVAVLGAVTAATGVAAVLLLGPVREDLVEFVAGFGHAAPLAFVVLYVILSLVLVPTSVLALAAGVLFGAALGATLTVVGGTVSAAIGFAVGRRLGREPVERLAGDRLSRADRWLCRHGVVAVAVARNVPALPYGLMNYAAGVTGIPAGRYLAGTVLGIVPGGVAFAMFGGSIDDLTSPQFYLAVVLLLVVVLGGALLESRRTPPSD